MPRFNISTKSVSRYEFAGALTTAREASPLIAEMTSAASDLPDGATFVLTTDQASGFYVTDEGYFGGLFSSKRGRGDELIADAIAMGATELDCFDGFLPTKYARHGFVETAREANWTPGGPDVVYMSRDIRA